jgi:hypothetical protein
MDELNEQVRAWTDQAALGDEGRITLDEVQRTTKSADLPAPAVADRRRRRRQATLAAAAAVLIGVIAGSVLLSDRPDTIRTGTTATVPGPTTTTTPEADAQVRQLAEGPSPTNTFPSPVATTQAGFDVLWDQAGLKGPQPKVDFDRDVVLAIASGGCGTVTGVHRTGDLLTPVWNYPSGCTLVYSPTAQFVAIDVATTGDRFRYRATEWDGVGPEPQGWTITVARPTADQPEPPSTVPVATTVPPLTKAERAELCPDIDTLPSADMAVLAPGTILVPELPDGYRLDGKPIRSTIAGIDPGEVSTVQTQQLSGPGGRMVRVMSDLGVPSGGDGRGKALAATLDLDGEPVEVRRCDEPAGQRITIAESDGRVTATLVIDGDLRWAIVGEQGATRSEVVAVSEALVSMLPDPWPRDGEGG